MNFYTDAEWSALNKIREAINAKASKTAEELLTQAWDAIESKAKARTESMLETQELARKYMEAACNKDQP